MRPEAHHKPGQARRRSATSRSRRQAPARDRGAHRSAPVRADHARRARASSSSRAAPAAARRPSACTGSRTSRSRSRSGFAPTRCSSMVFNDALARYISRVLPALGVAGRARHDVRAMGASSLRVTHLDALPKEYEDDTPAVVVRLKKSPAMLRILDEHVERLAGRVESAVSLALDQNEGSAAAQRAWQSSARLPLAHRLEVLEESGERPQRRGQEPFARGSPRARACDRRAAQARARRRGRVGRGPDRSRVARGRPRPTRPRCVRRRGSARHRGLVCPQVCPCHRVPRGRARRGARLERPRRGHRTARYAIARRARRAGRPQRARGAGRSTITAAASMASRKRSASPSTGRTTRCSCGWFRRCVEGSAESATSSSTSTCSSTRRRT